ncbi:hypothetical protein [Taklimakanibacter deserti]|uniref:hypothetical protein n=1 Tax=Taklimakanibacter deserti TaxID=2267839 RepID=UPI000E648591
MLDNIDIRKWIIAGLLILHIAWIGNHMRWVASGQINPWKLGGYAMYTIPNSELRLGVYLGNRPDAPIIVNTTGYNLATRFTNKARAFRCADVPAAALLAFFEENRALIGSNLVFVYSERQFFRSPPPTKIVSKRVLTGTIRVAWQDTQTFTYTNSFCGNKHTASATLPEALFATLP